MFQTKEQGKSPETHPTETEISGLLDREFKIMLIKMLTKVRRAMHGQSEEFNRHVR